MNTPLRPIPVTTAACGDVLLPVKLKTIAEMKGNIQIMIVAHEAAIKQLEQQAKQLERMEQECDEYKNPMIIKHST